MISTRICYYIFLISKIDTQYWSCTVFSYSILKTIDQSSFSQHTKHNSTIATDELPLLLRSCRRLNGDIFSHFIESWDSNCPIGIPIVPIVEGLFAGLQNILFLMPNTPPIKPNISSCISIVYATSYS